MKIKEKTSKSKKYHKLKINNADKDGSWPSINLVEMSHHIMAILVKY